MGREIYLVNIVGLPSSGKTTVAGRLVSGGYAHVSTDQVRDEMFDGKAPYELTGDQWLGLFSEFHVRKHLHLLQDENVATDNCPIDEEQRRFVAYVDPALVGLFAIKEAELRRYMVSLVISTEEYMRRAEERGRLKTKESVEYAKWITSAWKPVKGFSDYLGGVPVLEYENNTPEQQRAMLADLGEKLGVALL